MLDYDPAIQFTVTDLKQYQYCSRILYFQTCLPHLRPITYKMQAGITEHESERRRAVRRTFALVQAAEGKRMFDVAVQGFHLSGQIDEVIQTDRELIPVDYKLAHHAGDHFRLQLAAYALLLEKQFHSPVKRGFLYLIPVKQAVEVKITPTLRSQVEQALEAMQSIVHNEWMPPPTPWRQRCTDCEFRRFCNDV